MKSIFREYDIRGIFEKELNEDTVKKIGYFLGKKILSRVPNAKYVAIGYDARVHSPLLKDWLTSGLKKEGLEVLDMGMVPTPVNYFSAFEDFDGKQSSASVMITGSHNPPEYNGFKMTIDKAPFFGEDIYALGDEILLCDKIAIEDDTKTIPIDCKKRYIEYMQRNFSDLKLKDKKFVFDCGNGVAGTVLKDILNALNIENKILFEEPDGTFPNHHPDPSEAKNLQDIQKELSSGEFELGFAYDGDVDRIAVLSQKYNFKGDILAIFFSKNIKDPVVVGEVKCSQMMYDEISKIGKAYMYKTGHSNLKVKLKEVNASLAAEVSGHIFFNDRYFGYDDAIYSTLRVLEIVSEGFDLDSEFEKLPKPFSTDEITINTTEDKKFKIIDSLKKRLQNPPSGFPKIKDIVDVDGVRVIFEDGWGLVRASNTTPKLVTRFEAKDEKTAAFYEESLVGMIEG